MTTPVRIALVGPIGSGKTTIGESLLRQLGDGQRISIALEVKLELARAILAADGKNPTDDLLVQDLIRRMTDATTKAEFRELAQTWGTDFRRKHYGDDYWVRKAERKIIERLHANLLVDDCRFPNEYEMLRAQRFTFVRLPRNPEFPADPARDAHASEQYWRDFKVDVDITLFEKGVDGVANQILHVVRGA